jgi:hypothetical protein
LACYSLTDVPKGDWFCHRDDCVFTAEVAAGDEE